mmetsp:Transcript_9714/g.21346  ORF Transcript_9714/g.21346 Transcript_9714/m.21346 type:complete len:210 (+) Transcript_9714:219-848(+)
MLPTILLLLLLALVLISLLIVFQRQQQQQQQHQQQRSSSQLAPLLAIYSPCPDAPIGEARRRRCLHSRGSLSKSKQRRGPPGPRVLRLFFEPDLRKHKLRRGPPTPSRRAALRDQRRGSWAPHGALGLRLRSEGVPRVENTAGGWSFRHQWHQDELGLAKHGQTFPIRGKISSWSPQKSTFLLGHRQGCRGREASEVGQKSQSSGEKNC